MKGEKKSEEKKCIVKNDTMLKDVEQRTKLGCVLRSLLNRCLCVLLYSDPQNHPSSRSLERKTMWNEAKNRVGKSRGTRRPERSWRRVTKYFG